MQLLKNILDWKSQAIVCWGPNPVAYNNCNYETEKKNL